MQMPALMSRANYAGAEIFDGMAVLEFKLPKPCDVGDLLDEFDDQMELIILYHVIPSEATVMGHRCCAYSNPSFDYLYKVNGISDDNGIVRTRIKTNGRKLEKLVLESKMTTVLWAVRQENKYRFILSADGTTTKVPMGAFEVDNVENDIVPVLKALEDF